MEKRKYLDFEGLKATFDIINDNFYDKNEDDLLFDKKLDKDSIIEVGEIQKLINQAKIDFVDLGLSVNWSESDISKMLPSVGEGVDPVTTLLGDRFRKAQEEDYSELFQNSEVVFTSEDGYEYGCKVTEFSEWNWGYGDPIITYSWSFSHDEKNGGHMDIVVQEEGGTSSDSFIYIVSRKTTDGQEEQVLIVVKGGSETHVYLPIPFKSLKFVAPNGKSIDLEMQQNIMTLYVHVKHERNNNRTLIGEGQLLTQEQEELFKQAIPINELTTVFGTEVKVLSSEEVKELEQMDEIIPVYAVEEKGEDNTQYKPCYLDYNGLKVLISELAKIIRN